MTSNLCQTVSVGCVKRDNKHECDILNVGITATTDASMIEELTKARKLMSTAKETYWKASAILHNGFF